MLMYAILLLVICFDFGLEYLLKKYYVIAKQDINLTYFQKVIKYFFKFRYITVTLMVIMSTFKALTVGADTQNYFKYFNEMKDSVVSVTGGFEFGYNILNYLIIKLNLPFELMLCLISIFMSCSLVFFINNLSCNKFISFLMYVMLGTFAFSLSGLRQTIALGFIIIGIVELINNKSNNYTALVLLATLFHLSSIIMLVLLLIKNVKLDNKMIVTLIVLVPLLSLVLPYIMKLVEMFTPFNYYTKYFVNNRVYIGKTSLLNILYTVCLFIVFLVFYIAKNKFLKLNRKDIKLYNLFLLMFFCVPLIRVAGFMLHAQELFNRLTIYFMISLIILIPLFLKGVKNYKRFYNLTFIAVIVVGILYMVFLYVVKNTSGVYPFLFCIN